MLFDDFPGMTKEEWKQLILKTIKADTAAAKLTTYDQLLIQTPEPGLEIQPFYNREDLAGLEYLNGFHRLWTQTKQTTGWMNVVGLSVYDEKEANQQAREALAKGADAVEFNLLNRPGGKPMISGGVTEDYQFDFSVLLEDIPLLRIPVFFQLRRADFVNFNTYLTQLGSEANTIMGGITFEETVIWDWVLEDEHKSAFSTDFKNSMFGAGKTPYFKPLLIEPVGEPFDEGEMETFALPQSTLLFNQLSAAIRLIDYLHARGLPASQVLPQIGFSVDIGNDYFLQIATLRALRLLWWQIGRLYDTRLNLVDVFIHARTANAVPPENEPYKNLIANTTQAMSAIIGGCDALTVSSGGFASEKDTILAQRIARNVSAVLKEESYFDKVTDMGAGSYLIENLTHQLAKAVWERLK